MKSRLSNREHNRRNRRYNFNGSTSAFLRFQIEQWCTKVVKHPSINIILPLLISFIFSYPLLSAIHDPGQALSTLKDNDYVSKVGLFNEDIHSTLLNEADVQLSMLQIWVKPLKDSTNFLTKRTLMESLAFQTRLLKNVSSQAMISSPFQLWDHSLTNLQSDPSPLNTINENLLKVPRYSFFGLWKINGFVSSAAGFAISLLVNKEEYSNLRDLLHNNVEQLNEISNVTNFHILPSIKSESQVMNEILEFSMVKFGRVEKYLLILSSLLFMTYFVISMRLLKKSVKSVVGISVAIIAQTIFAISSSTTVTNFWFKNSNENLPLHVLYLPVIAFLVNEQLRLLRDISSVIISEESILNSLDYSKNADSIANEKDFEEYDKKSETSFISNLFTSHYKSTKAMIILSLIIILLVPFSRKATCFLLSCLWFGHFLECSYFTAVLSLDYRRLDGSGLNNCPDDNVFLDEDMSLISNRISGYKKFFTCNKLSSTSYSMLFALAYLIFFNERFSFARSSTSVLYKVFTGGLNSILNIQKPIPNFVFDQSLIANKVFQGDDVKKTGSKFFLYLTINNPIYVIKSTSNNLTPQVPEEQLRCLFDDSAFTSSYRIDLYYAFEFVLLAVLAISCTLLFLQKLMLKLDRISGNAFNNANWPDIKEKQKSKDRKDAKDGLSDSMNSSHDNSNTIDQFNLKELYRCGHTLDIIHIADSKSPFIVSVGLDYKVFVWSPLMKPIPNPTSIPLHRKFWPLCKVVLSNDGYHIAFFSKNGNVTTWSRKYMKFIWELQMKETSEQKNAIPLEAFFRTITSSSFTRKKLQSSGSRHDIRSGPGNGNSSDFFAMAAVGHIDASYENAMRTPSHPDDAEELTFVTAAGLVYSIHADGKIHVDTLTPSEHRLKSCKKLSSPRVNDRLVICDEIGDLYVSTIVNNKWRTRKLAVDYRNTITPPLKSCRIKANDMVAPHQKVAEVCLETDFTIELVSFVGMLLRVVGTKADLIDAQTGTVIRTFPIGRFKANSLRVFHDDPTHCRFCGSASVASFSIAYTDNDCSRITLQTFKLESRTKTSICLRVERDPREIRCLGMESAVETVHYCYNVENWCVTDNNMLMGIRRVPQSIMTKVGSSSVSRNDTEDEYTSLQKRKSKATEPRTENSSFRIHNIWEGWTMSANGTVILHKIPVGVNGLIVNRLGPLVRFGAKAMIVGFANIMDLFYIGHEDSIFTTEKDDSNREESSLKFVNKRRDRFSSKKIPLNYSTI